MKILEQILEEIEAKFFCVPKNKYESETVVLLDDVQEIIRSHMEDDGWIPVEEGYPTEKGWYQCTCDDRKTGERIWGNHTLVRDLFWNPNFNEFIDNIRYAENGHKNRERYFWTKYVTAWQPLPAPYQLKED